jgi:hypothetical protein
MLPIGEGVLLHHGFEETWHFHVQIQNGHAPWSGYLLQAIRLFAGDGSV